MFFIANFAASYRIKNSSMWSTVLVTGLGGSMGACLRFLSGKAYSLWGKDMTFPMGTFLINLMGCFLFGYLFGFLMDSNPYFDSLEAFLITGFCGGFTTFSSFSAEALELIKNKKYKHLSAYLILSNILGIFFLWAGSLIHMPY